MKIVSIGSQNTGQMLSLPCIAMGVAPDREDTHQSNSTTGKIPLGDSELT